MEAIRKLIKDERGLEAVEYAVILGLIVAATITAIGLLGIWVNKQYGRANGGIGA